MSGCATAVGTRTPSFGFGRRDMPSGRAKTLTIDWKWRRAVKPVLWKETSCITRTIRSMITSVRLIISRTLPRWRIRGQRGWQARSFALSKPDFSGSKMPSCAAVGGTVPPVGPSPAGVPMRRLRSTEKFATSCAWNGRSCTADGRKSKASSFAERTPLETWQSRSLLRAF